MFYFEFCVLMLWGWQYAASSPVSVTEYEYVREADAWLRLHIVPANWSDAAVLCQLEGGVLATPTTNALTNVMQKAMVEHKVAFDMVFIGATKLFGEGEFKSLDGESFTNTSLWRNFGEPDDAEDCLALTAADALTDISCARVLPYFCRKIVHNAPVNSVNHVMLPLSRCSQVGYDYEERTGSCYKFHQLAQSWRSAMTICRREGGHLAIINDRWESAVLGKMCANKIKAWDVIGVQSSHCLIGFRKWDDGAWGTVYGETPEKIKNFLPSIYNTGYCGAIDQYGWITAVECTIPSVYICQIRPMERCNVRTFWAE